MGSHREIALGLALSAAAVAVACENQTDLRARNANGVSLTSGTFDTPPPRPTASPINETMGNPAFDASTSARAPVPGAVEEGTPPPPEMTNDAPLDRADAGPPDAR